MVKLRVIFVVVATFCLVALVIGVLSYNKLHEKQSLREEGEPRKFDFVDLSTINEVTRVSTPFAGGATKSPLLVRGGAMTFFTKDNGGWGTGHGVAPPFCTSVNTSYIEIERLSLDGTRKNGPILDIDSGFFVPWKITIYGHKKGTYDGTESANGVSLQAQPTDCAKKTGNTSVTLTVLKQNSYYTNPLPPDGGRKESVRFKDPDCINDDPDICERMARVDVTVGESTKTYRCKDGDCSIYIGSD